MNDFFLNFNSVVYYQLLIRTKEKKYKLKTIHHVNGVSKDCLFNQVFQYLFFDKTTVFLKSNEAEYMITF